MLGVGRPHACRSTRWAARAEASSVTKSPISGSSSSAPATVSPMWCTFQPSGLLHQQKHPRGPLGSFRREQSGAFAVSGGVKIGKARASWGGPRGHAAGVCPALGQPRYASLGIAAGFRPRRSASSLAHSSITVTLDRYGHLLPVPAPRRRRCSTATLRGTGVTDPLSDVLLRDEDAVAAGSVERIRADGRVERVPASRCMRPSMRRVHRGSPTAHRRRCLGAQRRQCHFKAAAPFSPSNESAGHLYPTPFHTSFRCPARLYTPKKCPPGRKTERSRGAPRRGSGGGRASSWT